MPNRGSKAGALRRVTAVVAVLALVAVACDAGKVAPMAGTGTAGSTGDGGPATSAALNTPTGLVAIPGGGFYVTDISACVVRKVDPSGTITTVAGNGTCGDIGDGGPATSAEINPGRRGILGTTDPGQSGQLALDAAGDVYLADDGGLAIRRIDPSGSITTVASPSSVPVCATGFDPLVDFTVKPDGTLYVACPENKGVYRIDTDGTKQSISTASVIALATDPSGAVYASELEAGTGGHDLLGTLADDGAFTPVADATALTADPTLRITHLAVDATGAVYGAAGPSAEFSYLSEGPWYAPEPSGDAVYRFDAGSVIKIAGDGSPDPATGAQTGHGTDLAISPMGVSLDAGGNLLISSGHVVYGLADAAHAGNGSACNPTIVYPGADLTGADLHGIDLHDCDLTGVDLTGANLSGADLEGALLGGTVLAGTDVTGADLTGIRSHDVVGSPTGLPSGWAIDHGLLIGPGANLRVADLSGRDLTGIDLHGQDLTEADLDGTILTSANLSGATLTGTTLTGASSGSITGTPAALPTGWQLTDGYLIGPGANLTGADLSSANLANATLTGANLTSATLSSATLSSADLTNANLSDADVTGANLASATLTGTNLAGTALAGANLTRVKVCNIAPAGGPASLPTGWATGTGTGTLFLAGPSANLQGCDLTGADLTGDDLTGAYLWSANLTNVVLTGTTLTGVTSGSITGTPAALPTGWQLTDGYLIGPSANLHFTNLSGADLTNANLTGANLTNANLSGTILTGADLSDANLNGADLANTDLGSAMLTGVRSGSITGTPAALPTGWQLTDGYLIGYGANLSGANLTGAALSSANLSGANLTGAVLSSANLSYANLTYADLTNAVLDHVTANHATITGASFTGANFTRLRAGAMVGSPASLPTNWTLRGGFLVGSNGYLTGFNMTGVDLSGLDLTGASLAYSYLTDVNLTGTTLTNTILTSTNFTGATGTPTGGSTATYSNTACPDATIATAPATCVGHGFAT
jgi:uncharacterized protein YjbI with pentapeptide repeats